MTTALATAGASRAPQRTQRDVAAALGLAVLALRVDRAVLAGIVAQDGPRGAALALNWRAYEQAVQDALRPMGGLYSDAGDEQAALVGTPSPQQSGVPWLRTRAGLIVNSTQMGVLAVAGVVAARRLDPWAAAGALNRAAGLNRTQAVAVQAMAMSAPTAGARPLPEARLDAVADRYLRDRGATVAVTEAHAALVSGAVDAWSNSLPPDTYQLRWSGGECDVCAPLDGTTAALEDGFDTPCPAHPRCGCSIDLEMIPAAEVAA